ncbi:alpha-tocopherol transfer protein-like [Periplaneta americana]|uniref:alpha-tocopherol transfer protein-like n=1 Tax=Periplaneta americana TaxID=6978 RepID=UPI0037E86477
MSTEETQTTDESTTFDKLNIEEDSVKVQECINTLRELIEGEENLKVKTDDKFILRYLRWSDFKPGLAFHRLKKVYRFRARNKDWFCTKPPSEYETELGLNIHAILKERDSKGRRVFIVKTANIDADILTPQTMSHLDDLWLESVIDEEETQKNGLVIILDLAGYSWKMFSWITPNNSRVACIKVATVTIRKIELHVVNTSFLLNASMSLIYPFFDPRVLKHIHFHGEDWPSLHKHINPEILPEEYGGTGPSIDYIEARKILYEKSDYLMEIFSLGLINYEEELEKEVEKPEPQKDENVDEGAEDDIVYSPF